MAILEDNLKNYQEILIGLLPKDGASVGNKTLREELLLEIKKRYKNDLSYDEYWEIRNPLISSGRLIKGTGKGGSVSLSPDLIEKSPQKKRTPESNLYTPFENYLRDFWVKDNGLRDFIIQKTANQGKRKTGGKWTRPDFTLIAIQTYTFMQGRSLEVITFELKPAEVYDISGVFETASHSVFAHKSYLVLQCPNGKPINENFERIEKLCKNFGIGLVVFSNVTDIETYEQILDADRNSPDPSDVDDFVLSQINQKNQNIIHQKLK